MSSPSSRNPLWGGARKQSTEQQRHVRIWAELWGADIRHLRNEEGQLVGEVWLDDHVVPLRMPVEEPFGWRARTRTRTAVDDAVGNAVAMIRRDRVRTGSQLDRETGCAFTLSSLPCLR